MFEETNKNIIKEMIILKIRDIQIIYYCKKCHKKIFTFWETDGINGHFVVLSSVESELFSQYHADPQDILCLKCYLNLP